MKIPAWLMFIPTLTNVTLVGEHALLSSGPSSNATLEADCDDCVQVPHKLWPHSETDGAESANSVISPSSSEIQGTLRGNLIGSRHSLSVTLGEEIGNAALLEGSEWVAAVSTIGGLSLLEETIGRRYVQLHLPTSDKISKDLSPRTADNGTKLLAPFAHSGIGVWRLPDREFLFELDTNHEAVIAFDSVARENHVVAVTEKHLIVWALDTGHRDYIWPLPAQNLEYTHCFLVDGPRRRVFLDGGTGKFSWLLDYETGRVVKFFDPKGEPVIWCAVLSGEGSRLVVSDGVHRTSILDAESSNVLRTIEDTHTLHLLFVAGENRIITTSFWGTISCWDVETGGLLWSRDMDEELGYETGSTAWKSSLLNSDCGVTTGGDVIIFWHPATGEILDGMHDDEKSLLIAVNFGKRFVTRGWEAQRLRIWNIEAIQFRSPKATPASE